MKKNVFLKYFLALFFIVIGTFPKINFINISGSRTGIRLDDIMFLIYFIIFLYGIYKEGFRKYARLEKITKVFVICIISFLISNILGCLNNNVSLVISALHLIRKVQYFMLIYAGYDYYKLTSKESLKKLLVFTLMYHFLYTILEMINVIPDISQLIGRINNERMYSTFSGPYEFAGYLSLILIIFLISFLNKKTKLKKTIDLLLIVIIFTGVFYSESRISLIACIILLSIVVYINLFKNKILKISVLFLTVVLFAFAMINPLKIKQFDRLSKIDITSYKQTTKIAYENTDYNYYKKTGNINYSIKTIKSTSDLSFALRISKWTTLIKEAIKVPVFGMGLSLAGEAMDGSFVRLFVETGIVGLLLWCLLLITLLRESHKFSKDNFLIVLGLILSLVIGSTFIDIFEASKVMMPFWFIVGFIYSYENEIYYINKEKIKVAHIISGLNFGGVESVIYNYYNNMEDENFENIIISHSKINRENSKLFNKNKFKFYEVVSKRESLRRNYTQIKKILKEEQPDIVHVHMGDSSYIALIAAKKVGTRVRICHAHTKNDLSNLKGKITKFLCNIYANNYMACSEEACNNLFYKKNEKKCVILNNAIDLNIFDYNKKSRDKIRKEYKIEKNNVIGHVGRLSVEKNHEKLIDTYKEILKKDNKVKLMLIGDGEYKEEIIKMIDDIKDNVILIKNTRNIADYYNAMDVFVFPSIKEGLGISVIEAQVSGLPCLVSDTVPKDVKQTELVKFISLNDSDKIWANETIKLLKNKRKSYLKELTNSNYNIEKEAECLSNIYNNLHIKYI